jgi:hypothetical protein
MRKGCRKRPLLHLRVTILAERGYRPLPEPFKAAAGAAIVGGVSL